MAYTIEPTISSQIYKSRDYIKNEIIGKLQEYLELENVDLTKTSFLSFLIEILATNTSNLLFYQISTYREFFLTKAQLPESIYNLAAFLGYKPNNATPAEVDVLFAIPFGFTDPNVVLTLDNGFTLKAEGDIEFATYYTTTITITNNSNVSIVIREGNRTYIMPFKKENGQFLFILPFRQYSTLVQEFQISEDLQQYQFTSFEVPFSGQISEQIVEVKPPGSVLYDVYTEVSSLFLMSSSTKGYVVRRTDEGIILQFGNGLIGYQPEPGSTVRVTLSITNGANGNIIAGSIHKGNRIYHTTTTGITQTVEYDVTNTSPAVNGKDEESLETIRRNAITNLTALNRIVTENDFINTNTIVKNSPLGQNSLPVLKRSDLKINEISLFSTLFFESNLVPTRNMFATFTDTFVPRQTVLTENGIDYYTAYDMEIELLNSSANYTYNMYEIEQRPTLVTNYGSSYNLYATNLIVKRNGTQAIYELVFDTTESDYLLSSCKMEISETGATFDMVIDSTSFILTIPDNQIIPTGNLTYFFTISHSIKGLIAQYSSQFVFRLSLEDFTTSNVTFDGTSYVVYDIPVIQKEYYDNVDERVFELQVFQSLLTTVTFKDYKMLTDFVNLKFANTIGTLNNMQLNNVDLAPVLSIQSTPPDSTASNDRYIVLNGTGAWKNHDNDIAVSVYDGTACSWVFITPKYDQMVLVQDQAKKYIYSETKWVIPSYSIPLKLSLDVFRTTTYTGTLGDLTQTIRTTLVEAFNDRFGINTSIYRSEIIDVVQEIDGVDHCHLISPESSIFFNFNIDEFTQEQLLKYAPEYVYFTEDDISIRIF